MALFLNACPSSADPENPCDPNPCAEPHKTTCVRDAQSFRCVCDPGFEAQGNLCLRHEPQLCSQDGWYRMRSGTRVILSKVWGEADGQVWVAGEGGTILHHGP
jgi:hypothetical protein